MNQSTGPRMVSRLWRRRAGMWLAGLAGVAAAVLAIAVVSVPLHYPPSQLRAEMERQVQRATGLVTTRDGTARFSFLPQPHVEIENVGFADPTGGIRLKAAYLRGYPRLFSLLTGRIELASVTLNRPDLTVDLDSNALAPDSAIGRAAAAKPATQEARRADAARLGIVVIEDGRVRLKSHAAADATIDAINATLDWRNLGAPVILRGQAHMHRQPTDLALWIGAPSELLRGGRSAIRLILKSDMLALSSSGSLATTGGVAYRGRLSATGASLHDAVALLGYDLTRQPAADDFSVRGDVDFADDRLMLSNLRLHLLQNDFEGAVAIETRSQRKAVSGTLAADTLRLAPFVPSGGTILRPDGGWSDTSFDPAALDLADLDLRISAARATLGDFVMTNAALSVMTRRGSLELGLADATLYGGKVRARLALQAGDAGITGQLTTTLAAVDLAAAPWNGAGDRHLSGRTSGSLTLESSGRDMADLIGHLAGRVDLTVAQGALSGIDVEQALRRTEKRPQAGSVLANAAGRTPFGLAQIALHVNDGVAHLDDTTFSGPGSHIAVNGQLDLRRRALDVDAVALQAGTDGVPSETGPRVRFGITGPLSNPTIEQTDGRRTVAVPVR